ncbi:acetate--CoA ligase [Halobacterium zhouii]|uniref:acetate--CoA ligase n=1 Tax=Halobacterium zhouii TaxID=2902624 RepID=UPI001E2FEF21|nr:acetate--CoA ligase [Halobacterium zhouii]
MADGERVTPPEWFVEQANVRESPREAFEREWPDAWERAANLLSWDREYDDIFDAGPPYAWFPGGRLNACYNCVDRHLEERKNQVAIAWEGQLGERRTYTYLDLYREVNEFAAALRDIGVEEDDVVTTYLPVVPELPIAMLACARIGAVHNVVFADFSADALANRMRRADSEHLVTCDGYYPGGGAVDQKSKADNACLSLDADVESVVVDRLSNDTHLGDCYAYDDLLERHAGAEVEPVAREATDRLFRIYTSGTTGQPKAVDHTTGGYLAQVAWTTRSVLDVKPGDTYWCGADVSWITGHSYVVYGPLALGTTPLLVEGAMESLGQGRPWELVERHSVDVLYTSPTAIRAFMKRGTDGPANHDLSSLRLLGSVGEPLDSTVWEWYREHVGGGECPVVDTWWQTETGAILLATLPGVDDMEPGAVGPPLPGVNVEVVDDRGETVGRGDSGYLTITRPWPAMPQSVRTGDGWADRPPGADWRYYPDDRARVTDDGYVAVLGRTDDVVNVGGRRFSTLELESAIVAVDGIAEAAVIVGNHYEKGRAIHAYVSPEHDYPVAAENLRERARSAVESVVGTSAPETVVFTPELPKTRSGKIMRRLLISVANGESLGDTSALRNPEVVGELRNDATDE